MTEQNYYEDIDDIKLKLKLKLVQDIALSHNKIEETNKEIHKKYSDNKQYLVFLNNILNDSIEKYNIIIQNLN